MNLRHLTALVVMTAAAVTAAPSAAAVSNPIGCRDHGSATVCQKQGHATLRAKPEVRTPSGSLWSSPWLPGYGRGHLPPLLALD